ncbi:hypothetical protein Nepgr_021072 [Nepenthes gracilis]|uniref:Uncharacterized protein n=1 Tax=Nepenthes gracilis TaxID=150966 RepID=A0AAD3XX03_NEPGR|nr:hypothetical protein Nepgr_021072 [Nepenthes gracilis]
MALFSNRFALLQTTEDSNPSIESQVFYQDSSQVILATAELPLIANKVGNGSSNLALPIDSSKFGVEGIDIELKVSLVSSTEVDGYPLRPNNRYDEQLLDPSCDLLSCCCRLELGPPLDDVTVGHEAPKLVGTDQVGFQGRQAVCDLPEYCLLDRTDEVPTSVDQEGSFEEGLHGVDKNVLGKGKHGDPGSSSSPLESSGRRECGDLSFQAQEVIVQVTSPSRSAIEVITLGAPHPSNSPLRLSDKREGGAYSNHAQEVENQVTTPSPSEQDGRKKIASWLHMLFSLLEGRVGLGLMGNFMHFARYDFILAFWQARFIVDGLAGMEPFRETKGKNPLAIPWS